MDAKARLEYLQKLEKEKQLKELKDLLPHKYSPVYDWQREFIESKNKMNLCTAGNQCGKSTWMIIKAITHATEPELWPSLWPEMHAQGMKPTQFWYLYEDKAMIMREFTTKWIPEWLPRGKARYEGKYRWEYAKKDKTIEYIYFPETNVYIYFFSYGQGVDALQASTVWEMFIDEELPFESYDELSARLTIPRGFFNAGFTAVKGQDEWRKAMEPMESEEEMFPDALKRQISAYMCRVKEDASPGLWDDELIKLRTAQCSTHAMVLQKIYGKFIRSDGLMVSQFDSKKHFVKGQPLVGDWTYWAAVDPGSGGEKAHPAGVIVMAVNEDCTSARVIKAWRGDKQDTSNSMILQKYLDLTANMEIAGLVYDKACRDIFILGQQMGLPMIPANKARDEGFGVLNSLFKHDMLKIFFSSSSDETHKLKSELLSYSGSQSKTKTSTPDNLIDPLRYLCMQIPWNLDKVINYNIKKQPAIQTDYATGRDAFIKRQQEGLFSRNVKDDEDDGHESLVSSELDEFNDYLDDY